MPLNDDLDPRPEHADTLNDPGARELPSTPTFPSDAESLLNHLKLGTARRPVAPAPAAGTFPTIPNYEIESELGRGGMGVVYKAKHTGLHHTVAIKMILASAHASAGELARFLAEAEAIAAVKHPNVVQVFDLGDADGRPFFVMEYVAGGNLAARLKDAHLDPATAARLIEAVARGVQTAHEEGIVHRDLKPLNILLTPEDEPLVADFGLVKFADDDQGMSITLVPLGTRQYMSPEQTLGGHENYTHACDIWALGIIVYELLAGYRPYSHEDTAELYRMIRHEPVPPLPVRVNAPAGLEAIARKCLAKSAGDRYQTADEVAADLDKWVAGETIPMPRERTPRRRMRAAFAAVAMVALLGFSGIPAQAPREENVPAPRSVADRLRAGETVVLIGEKGLPVVQGAVPGRDGALALRPNGYATLASPVFSAVELCAEELPWPIKFRAEYAVTEAQDGYSRTGVYVGRKPTPGADPCQSLVQLTHTEAIPARAGGPPQGIQAAAFELAVWADATPEARTTFQTVGRTVPVPAAGDRAPRWHTVEVVIRPDVLGGTWNGIPLDPLFGPRLANQKGIKSVQPRLDLWANGFAREHPNRPVPMFTAPYFGPGIGVCAFNATAMYRKVTLELSRP